MKLNRVALRDWVHKEFAAERAALGTTGVAAILEAGKQWDLAPALNAGGAVVFSHAVLPACGHQIATAIYDQPAPTWVATALMDCWPA